MGLTSYEIFEIWLWCSEWSSSQSLVGDIVMPNCLTIFSYINRVVLNVVLFKISIAFAHLFKYSVTTTICLHHCQTLTFKVPTMSRPHILNNSTGCKGNNWHEASFALWLALYETPLIHSGFLSPQHVWNTWLAPSSTTTHWRVKLCYI